MAKFCNQCGRPLQEGEVCNCTAQRVKNNMPYPEERNPEPPYGREQQRDEYYPPYRGQQQGGYQQPYGGPQGSGYQEPYGNPQEPGYQQPYGNPQGPGYQQPYGNPQGTGYQMPPQVSNFMTEFKLFFKRFLPFVKDPIGELRNTYQRNNISSGLYMFLSCFIMSLIYLIILCFRLSMDLRSRYGDWYDYATSLGSDYGPDIPYFRIIFGVLLVLALTYFISSGILCGLSKGFSGNKVTFAQILTVTGSTYWYMCFFIVVACVFTLIHWIAGVVILGIGFFMTSFLQIITFCELVPMKSSNKFYTWILYVVCQSIVFTVIYSVVLGSVLVALDNLY